jgi:preprotein translocase subunit SecG
MNDFLKLNKFIQKIYCILTKKFFFFHLLINIYKQNKTSDKCNNDKSKINEDIDFLIDDSSEQSED